MKKDTTISNRKNEHIHINLLEDVNSGRQTGLEQYHFIHQALPEISLSDVDLSQTLFGKRQAVPVLVSSMTGGSEEGERINRNLAVAAQEVGMAMGVGSQRAAISDPSLESTFKIRHLAPSILLFANLGAVQLNYGFTIQECQRAIDMIEADGLILHLNPLQEALQPKGNTDFGGLAKKIAEVRKAIPIPLIVKEVGWGISIQTAQLLYDAGVDAVDVAGAGGTSWSQVEKNRIDDEFGQQTAGSFIDWGIPTADSLANVLSVHPEWIVFASGGLVNGIDIAKCIALGAKMGGMAGRFLQAASISEENAVNVMRMITDQIRIAMFASGSRALADLTPDKLTRSAKG
jgi:isopentenyl-diphosphate delta-isomerase